MKASFATLRRTSSHSEDITISPIFLSCQSIVSLRPAVTSLTANLMVSFFRENALTLLG
jgi:hypothetical protein